MKRCGFSRQTFYRHYFYRHYLDIYDVIDYIFVQDAVFPSNQDVSKCYSEIYINYFRYCLESIVKSVNYYIQIINIQEYNFIERGLYKYFIDCTIKYIGHSNWDSDLATVSSIYYSGVAKEIYNWIKKDYNKDSQTFAWQIYNAMPEKMKIYY